MKKVKVFTDGACSRNPGPGGWGVLIIHNKKEKELFGGEEQTTNNRMELKAAIEALKFFTEPTTIEINTDSMYLKNGITEWIISWKKNNWKNTSKKTIKNYDLWVELDNLIHTHKLSWKWIKAHSGNYGNEKADQLANRGIFSINKKSL